MKKLYRKLQFINKQIRTTEAEIKNVKTLPFYDVFKREGQREQDIHALNTNLKDLLTQKSAVLDNMSQKINCIRLDVAEKERSVTIIKNSLKHETN
jgi:hypothetical protein